MPWSRQLAAVLTVVSASCVTAPVAADTWYVDDDAPADPGPGDPSIGDPAEDGSRAHPFDAVQEAIDAAAEGDEVLVLDGLYQGVGNRDLNTGGTPLTVRSASDDAALAVIDAEGAGRVFVFESGETSDVLVRGLTITGGFNEDLGGGVLCDAGSSPTFEGCRFTGNAAGWGGGLAAWMSSSPTLVGCVFADNEAETSGGGVFAQQLCAPMLTDCEFEGNTATFGGGLLAFDRCDPVLENCTFVDNEASNDGGAVYVTQNGSLTATGCVFDENRALGEEPGDNGDGGAVIVVDVDEATCGSCTFTSNWASDLGAGFAATDGVITLDQCTFESNVARFGGAVITYETAVTMTACSYVGNESHDDGGAVYLTMGPDPIVAACSFEGNVAGASDSIQGIGGGLVYEFNTPMITGCQFTANHADRGGAIWGNDSVLISDCTFDANAADRGGAIYFQEIGVPIMRRCRLSANQAITRGGALYLDQVPLVAASCRFLGNMATDEFARGGGIYVFGSPASFVNCVFSGNSAMLDGGALWAGGANASFAQCTIVGNVAGDEGGGVYSTGLGLVVDNSILWDNRAATAAAQIGPGDPELCYSVVEGGWAGRGGNNLASDPILLDADGADGMPGTIDDDLRLGAASPAIDAGDGTMLPADAADLDDDGDVREPLPLDLAGGPRVIDDPDVPDALGPPVDIGAYERQPGAPCPADLDGNLIVDVDDLVIVLLGWGDASGDVDGDGTTDVDDLVTLLLAWGPCL